MRQRTASPLPDVSIEKELCSERREAQRVGLVGTQDCRARRRYCKFPHATSRNSNEIRGRRPPRSQWLHYVRAGKAPLSPSEAEPRRDRSFSQFVSGCRFPPIAGRWRADRLQARGANSQANGLTFFVSDRTRRDLMPRWLQLKIGVRQPDDMRACERCVRRVA